MMLVVLTARGFDLEDLLEEVLSGWVGSDGFLPSAFLLPRP